MKNRNTVVAVVIAIVLIIGISYFVQTRGKIVSFEVASPYFVAETKNLSKVEVWSVTTQNEADGTDAEQSLFGEAILAEGEVGKGPQTWTFHIPITSLSVSEIYVKGYNRKGGEAGTMSLPYDNATSLFEAVWGEDL